MKFHAIGDSIPCRCLSKARRTLARTRTSRSIRLSPFSFLARGLGHCGFAPLRSQIGGNMMKDIACNARNVYTAHEK